MIEVFEPFVIREDPDPVSKEAFEPFKVLPDVAPPERKIWGHHYVCDLSECDKNKVSDIENIKAFSEELLRLIDMKPLGEPYYQNLVNDEAVSKGIDGYSYVQFIHTSSLTMHFVNSVGEVYCDLFSCKSFEPQVVKDCMRKYFDGVVKTETVIVR